MDVYFAVASKRDWRSYAPERPLPAEVEERILDAGRLAGSARNRQLWRFLVVESDERRRELAKAVYVPGNVEGAALVVAIVTPGGAAALDVGRAAQNMMLTAWEAGVVSCPNGIADAASAVRALELTGDDEALVVLSFGYPDVVRDPARRSAREWSERADRKPLADVVERL